MVGDGVPADLVSTPSTRSPLPGMCRCILPTVPTKVSLMPPLTPARCRVQIGRAGSAVGRLVACCPRAHLATLGNFQCTSAAQTTNLGVWSSNLSGRANNVKQLQSQTVLKSRPRTVFRTVKWKLRAYWDLVTAVTRAGSQVPPSLLVRFRSRLYPVGVRASEPCRLSRMLTSGLPRHRRFASLATRHLLPSR